MLGMTFASILEILIPLEVWLGMSKSRLKGLNCLKQFSSMVTDLS